MTFKKKKKTEVEGINLVDIVIVCHIASSNKLIVCCIDIMMQCERVKVESVTHNYYNSSTKPKFYKNTRLACKIIEKASLANFYSKTHIT